MLVTYLFDIRPYQAANRVDWFLAPEGATMEQAVLEGFYADWLDFKEFRRLEPLWDYCQQNRITIS